MRKVFVHIESSKDIGGLQGRAGARAAAGHGHVLQRHQQRLSLHVCERCIEVAPVTLRHVPVEKHVGQVGGDAVVQTRPQPVHVRGVVSHFSGAHSSGASHSHAQRRRQCSRSQTPLLPPTVHYGFEANPRPPAHEQRADTLRAVPGQNSVTGFRGGRDASRETSRTFCAR